MTYKVLQAKRGGFFLRGDDGKERLCPAMGRLREDGIFAGDNVELDRAGGIERVLPRQNLLIRPPLANVTACVIVMSPLPEPDFYLIDKLLVHCQKNGIKPTVAVNKSDTADAQTLFDEARANYGGVLFLSAEDGTGIDELLSRVSCGRDGLVCLAGQSAVGKSSLLNRLLGLNLEVGELSQKIERGKNTTRACRLYPLPKGGYIADTPGFSMLDAGDILFDNLKYFYPEFEPFMPDCKMRGCNHISEPNCAVLEAVESGKIHRGRWERYVVMFAELVEFDKNKYK